VRQLEEALEQARLAADVKPLMQPADSSRLELDTGRGTRAE
jgi:hypothetical protein